MVVLLSVFVIDRSATAATVSESVADWSVVVGSVTPAGGATDAVLAIVPVVAGATVPVRVNVADPDDTRSTVVEIDPLPLVAAQLLGRTAAHVQVAPVSDAGNVSVTSAPIALDGPALVTTIV